MEPTKSVKQCGHYIEDRDLQKRFRCNRKATFTIEYDYMGHNTEHSCGAHKNSRVAWANRVGKRLGKKIELIIKTLNP